MSHLKIINSTYCCFSTCGPRTGP